MKYNLTISTIYTAILMWIYDMEIAVFWRYMRFEGSFDNVVFAEVAIGVVLLSSLLPFRSDTRTYLLTCLHYFFFLPSVVYIAFNEVSQDYYISFIFCSLIIYLGSAVPVRSFEIGKIQRKYIFFALQVLIFIALILQAAFGGLASFNLDLELVYQFRSATSANMPAIFGYLYSNVASVLIPGSIALSLYYRQAALAMVGVLAGILLFAMAHHKSILFTTLMVFLMFLIIDRHRSPKAITIFPLAIVAVCGMELIWLNLGQDSGTPGLLTSYLVRRTLLVPPMLDAASIELFNNAPKYFWSTSRLGLGIAENPYQTAAPFLIGTEFFDDSTMSANAGLIGSGYSNAGILGTVLYSTFMALTISFINSIGKKVGPELITVLSFPTILLIFTSTDLTTALLTHGLLMLLCLISILPEPHCLSDKI